MTSQDIAIFLAELDKLNLLPVTLAQLAPPVRLELVQLAEVAK